MFDIIRDAVVGRRLDGIRQDLLQAGRSMQHLIRQPKAIETMDSQNVWTLLHGMQAALHIAEKTLSNVRRETQGTPSAEIRGALRDMQTATLSLRQVLEEAIIPHAKNSFPFPQKETRWRIQPPDHLA